MGTKIGPSPSEAEAKLSTAVVSFTGLDRRDRLIQCFSCTVRSIAWDSNRNVKDHRSEKGERGGFLKRFQRTS
jgi:hypothetical protein